MTPAPTLTFQHVLVRLRHLVVLGCHCDGVQDDDESDEPIEPVMIYQIMTSMTCIGFLSAKKEI